MTERAERLAKFLEAHGWGVFGQAEGHYCNCDPNLDHNVDAIYCFKCGQVLQPLLTIKEEILDELEQAIKFSLGE